MTATPVGVDRVPERHMARRGDLVDDAPGVDVKELEPPVLPDAHVALEELVVGEETGSAAVVRRQSPPDRSGLGHWPEVSRTPVRSPGRWARPNLTSARGRRPTDRFQPGPRPGTADGPVLTGYLGSNRVP